MPGYRMLSNFEINDHLSGHYQDIKEITHHDDNAVIANYYLDDINKVIITTFPVKAYEIASLYDLLQKNINDFTNYQLLIPVMGPGISEYHIVFAHYKAEHQTKTIYDSKTSDIEKLMSKNTPFSLMRLFKGAFNALRPNYRTTTSNNEFNYVTLGTQALFDGKSCGYHTVANIKACHRLITENKPINKQTLLSALYSPVGESAQAFGIDMRFQTYMTQAWQKTLPNGENSTQYFMGYPKQSRLAKTAYFLTLGFIVNPAINILKIATEGMLNGAAACAHYCRDRLISWTPKYTLTRYIRTPLVAAAAGIQRAFAGACYLIKPITSPMTSFKAAWKKHPVLGVMSGIATAFAYSLLVAGLIIIGGISIGAAMMLMPALLLPVTVSVLATTATISAAAAVVGVHQITKTISGSNPYHYEVLRPTASSGESQPIVTDHGAFTLLSPADAPVQPETIVPTQGPAHI